MNYSIEYLMDIFKKLEWENSKYRAYQKLIKDIESLEKIEGNEYEPAILNMYFYNGEEYILNSDADTNEHHMKVFNETINEIASLLLGA